MKDEIFWIPGPWTGRLGITPRPRGGDWLEDDIRAWRNAGVHLVISLLGAEEARELGLEAEASRSRQEGLEFHSFPVPDLGVPESLPAFGDLVHGAEATLGRGRNVVIHCRQSVGRSSLLAASLLISAGESPESAFRKIGQVRGVPVPETEEQRRWIERFAEESVPVRS